MSILFHFSVVLFSACSNGCPCLDYSKGFGGKFGVEKEKVDKAALGYDYKAQTEKHQSQKGAHKLAPAYNRCQCWVADLWFCSDYSAGFGGRYGVQADRMDKVSMNADWEVIYTSLYILEESFGKLLVLLQSAAGFSDIDSPTSAYEKTQPLEACMSMHVLHVLSGFFGFIHSILSFSQCRRWKPEGPFWEHGQGLRGGEQEEGRGGEGQETSKRESRARAGQTKTGGLRFLHANRSKSINSNSCCLFLSSCRKRESKKRNLHKQLQMTSQSTTCQSTTCRQNFRSTCCQNFRSTCRRSENHWSRRWGLGCLST